MSSRKRTGLEPRKELSSRSRNALSSSSKLRMDSRPQQPRITDPSLPAGRRREIDTMMKKARSSPNSNGYWDKKLLEVEAKDPNRWRHSGYKAMYIAPVISSSASPSPQHRRRSRSPRSTSRSPRSTSRSPRRPRARPAARPAAATRHSRSRSRPRGARRPRSPRSPPSPSSLSSCSDDECEVCEPKHRGGGGGGGPAPQDRMRARRGERERAGRERSRSYSVPRVRAGAGGARRPRPPASPPSDPRRAAPASRARPRLEPPQRTQQHVATTSSTSSQGLMMRQGGVSAGQPGQSQAAMAAAQRRKKDKAREKDKHMMLTHIKTERTKPKRRRSPAAAESSGSEDSSSSSLSAVVASTRLTLSERFGKMAQWSVDRRDIENMRITKNSNSGDLKVMIEAEERMYDNPPLRYSHSPAPIGHYPDELLISGPTGLTAWDDVRVRYQYYKDLGYLRDLTLDDYVKWEQWWYKYQEWLKNERYYEHWLTSQSRRRRKRLPATQRLN